MVSNKAVVKDKLQQKQLRVIKSCQMRVSECDVRKALKSWHMEFSVRTWNSVLGHGIQYFQELHSPLTRASPECHKGDFDQRHGRAPSSNLVGVGRNSSDSPDNTLQFSFPLDAEF